MVRMILFCYFSKHQATDPPTTFAAPQSKLNCAGIVLNFTLFLFSTNYRLCSFSWSHLARPSGVVVGVSVLACVISVLVPVLVCYCLGVGVFGAIGCCLAKKIKEGRY